MHENLKHTLIKHLTKKIQKVSYFQSVTTNNRKHFFRFHINQYWQFQGGTTKWYYNFFQSSYETRLTFSESYLQTRVNTLFRVHIKHYWYFQGVTSKQYYTLFQTSNNTDISRKLLVNNITNFSRFHIIKQYWHFQRITEFLSSSTVISYNTDTFKELLPNYIELLTQYWLKHYSDFHSELLPKKIKNTFFESVNENLNR